MIRIYWFQLESKGQVATFASRDPRGQMIYLDNRVDSKVIRRVGYTYHDADLVGRVFGRAFSRHDYEIVVERGVVSVHPMQLVWYAEEDKLFA